MIRSVAWLLLLPVSACGMFDTAPETPIPAICESQVYADPAVKDLIMKSAGSGYFANNHLERLKVAKQDAAVRCMQQKGLARPGGGVERPRIEG